MIDIAYFKAPSGNFGDDLNSSIWKHVLPEEVLASNKLTIIGIGSILNAEFISRARNGRKIIVLGSGVSYGRIPEKAADVEFRAVRGPLSAALVGVPEASITDGAALLATPSALRALMPAHRTRTDVLFMPHHESLPLSRWKSVAEQAGISFVDPRDPVQVTLTAFAKAKLVIAEAMHAAIVADTLRIPWIPVTSSPHINDFKWTDWTLSLGVPYQPVHLPIETFDHWRVVWKKFRRAETLSWSEAKSRPPEWIKNRYNNWFTLDGNSAAKSHTLLNPKTRKTAKGIASLFDQITQQKAVKTLIRLSTEPGYLSSEPVFTNRHLRLWEAAEGLRKIV